MSQKPVSRARRLRGQAFADEILAGVALRLVTVLVGDDPASAMYVEMKHTESASYGLPTRELRLSASISQSELNEAIAELSNDVTVTSVLVQYPLPGNLDYFDALRHLDPDKDVDGLHPINLGLLAAGETSGIIPCTPRGIVTLLEKSDVAFENANVVVVGRGLTVGRPLSILLGTSSFGYNATVTLCHSRTVDLARHVRQADVVIAAAGYPGLITSDMVHQDQVVVTAGVSFVEGKAKPDIDMDARETVAAFTTTTGAVGPMTRAYLFSNAVENARRSTLRATSPT
jgi:methylenetetrahydrofolate dehydrogenase (NADP+)/methenyltetrahydrofolate cyclohydrolase